MMSKLPKCGDIIRLKYNSHYYYIRILVDLEAFVNLENVSSTPLYAYTLDARFLIEGYLGLDDTALPTGARVYATISKDVFKKGIFDLDEWTHHGHISVKPEDIEFPEYVSGRDEKNLYFLKGEFKIPTTISASRYSEFHTSQPNFLFLTGVVLYILSALDRLELATDEDGEDGFPPPKQYDLRFNSERRIEIYNSIGLSQPLSYSELSKRLGKDVNRFLNKP